METTVLHRETCRLCDSANVELVVKLEPIPLSENYCSDSETGLSAARYPVDLYMCRDCGHVHQLDVVDSKSLWENYTYYSGDAKGMPEHFNQVASDIIEEFSPNNGSLVIDIGSNDGSLLRPFKEKGYRVLGIDPATEIARIATQMGLETIPELMTLKLAEEIKIKHGLAKIICMFNAFAHADNMSEIANSIRVMLDRDGVFIFEAQYLMDIIDRMLIATIFHEHMSHHSVKALKIFLNKHDLELVKVKRVPIQHGSLIGVVQIKGGALKEDPSVQEFLDLEKKRNLDSIETLKAFGQKIELQKTKLKTLANEWRRNEFTVAGYGAARSGPTLISQLGLTGAIQYIFDDHPQKVGRFSSGDGIPIIHTRELLARMPAFTIILAWVHADKIIEANQEYLDRGGKFVVLCPEARIVSKNESISI